MLSKIGKESIFKFNPPNPPIYRVRIDNLSIL